MVSYKKGAVEMNAKHNVKAKILKAVAKSAVKIDANSTSCIILCQPKAPASLKKFSKIDNDK